MSHTRPSGAGWVEGQQGEPVEAMADPPGDAIGPDLTPPDQIPGQDKGEHRRLAKDHRDAVKQAGQVYTDDPGGELHESAEEPRTADPFESARATEPGDPQPEDPRQGKGAR